MKQGISYAFSRPTIGAYTIVTVDLNGPLKKPNVQGKDLFFFNRSREAKRRDDGDKSKLLYPYKVSKNYIR